MFHSDIIPWDLESNVWRNNAYSISYIRKKGKWIWLKGDGMMTEWQWMVTEWSLKCTCRSVDWIVTERWLNGAFQISRNGGDSSCVWLIINVDPLFKFISITFLGKRNIIYALILLTNILELLLGIAKVKNNDTHKIQSPKLYLTKLTFQF